ncbi:MAG: DUF4292 domain-containing protein [Rhodothermales bacterium]
MAADKKRLLAVCSLAGVILFAGCSGPRPALEREMPSAFPHHTVYQIRSLLTSSSDSLTSFRARSSLAYQTPDGGGSFSADIRDRRGDSLFVSISPGLGIEAARALVTPDSFFFYDRIKNRLLFGALSDTSGILPEPFTSEDLFGSLLGLQAPASDESWSVDADDAFYYLRDPEGLTEYVIDPAHWRVVRYEKRNSSGEVTHLRRFSEFDDFSGVVLPRRLEFEQPLEGSRASIYYRSITLNPQTLRFRLDVRDSTERISVSE